MIAKYRGRIALAENNREEAETNVVTSLSGIEAKIIKEKDQIEQVEKRIQEQGDTFNTIAEGIEVL